MYICTRWGRGPRHGSLAGQHPTIIDYRTGYIRSHLRSPSGRVRWLICRLLDFYSINIHITSSNNTKYINNKMPVIPPHRAHIQVAVQQHVRHQLAVVAALLAADCFPTSAVSMSASVKNLKHHFSIWAFGVNRRSFTMLPRIRGKCSYALLRWCNWFMGHGEKMRLVEMWCTLLQLVEI